MVLCECTGYESCWPAGGLFFCIWTWSAVFTLICAWASGSGNRCFYLFYTVGFWPMFHFRRRGKDNPQLTDLLESQQINIRTNYFLIILIHSPTCPLELETSRDLGLSLVLKCIWTLLLESSGSFWKEQTWKLLTCNHWKDWSSSSSRQVCSGDSSTSSPGRPSSPPHH